MTDEQPPDDGATDSAAGLSDERIEQHLNAGQVRVDGELVTDPATPAPPPARIVITAP